MYDILRGVLLTNRVVVPIPVRFYRDVSVSVAELLVGSSNMFPNTISLDLLPHRDRFKYLTLHDARRSCYTIMFNMQVSDTFML